MRDLRAVAAGVGIFLALAPLVACLRQVTLLLVALLLGTTTGLLETYLLSYLPVDPVYGGAGLRVLGSIEPRGLAIAGWPGVWLHALAPAIFSSPDYAAYGAAVSALVAPGLTVLARVLAAILATSILVALAGLAAARLRSVPLTTAVRLAHVWLLLDLAQETDLSIRDLEATGLPFALAAFSPVDAHGQRVMLTSQLDGVPHVLIGGVNAVLAIASCLLLAWLLSRAATLGWSVAGLLVRPSRRRAVWQQIRAFWRQLGAVRLHRPGLPAYPLPIARPTRAGVLNRAQRLARPGLLVALALALSLSPLRSFAEGEATVLPLMLGEHELHDDLFDQHPLPEALPAAVAAQTAGTASVTLKDGPTPAATMVPTPMPTSRQPATADTPVGSHVVVEGGNFRYTLRVDKRTWVVRGMGYNPWYARLPIPERQARYRRDFSLMRETGINTLEGWFQDQFDEVTLDEAHRHGLKVIMPFELNQDYDYTDPATRERFRNEVTAWVLRYHDHPAVLMWGPGNEVMHRLIFPTAVQGKRDPAREQRADAFAAFYVELMDLIHQLDPKHPVIYRDAEDLYLARFRAQIQQRPAPRPWFVYGTNVYTSRIAQVIDRWPTQGLDAPLLVSEFSPGGAGEADRPRMLRWYWSTIRTHPQRVLGGVVYTWATRGPEDLDRVFGLTDDAGAPVDGSLAAVQQLFRPDLSRSSTAR